MATYPVQPALSQPLSVNSEEATLDDIQIDRATNGRPKARAMYTAPKKTFTLVHELATAADKSTLDAFYLANRLLAFDMVWPSDGITYSCLFSGPPRIKAGVGRYFTITNTMVQA